jgi:hypothetical protein
LRTNSPKKSSGQILIVSTLVVSLVLLSTQLYIIEVCSPILEMKSTHANSFVSAIRLGSKHAIIGSLANITNGGLNSILRTNLAKWENFTSNMYQLGKPILSFSLKNTIPYTNGVYLSWGITGFAVSSAYVDFNLSLSDQEAEVQTQYAINVTTSITQEATFRVLQGDNKQVNVTCNVFNEGKPALAENITICYDYMGIWYRADTLNVYDFFDYGNGTYSISFEANIPGSSVIIQVFVDDLRGIFVKAAITCTEL